MKPIRVILFFGLLTALIATTSARLVADEYQVPVIEGVEAPDSPAVDAARGDAEARLPAVGSTPAGVQPPGADRPADVEQPAVEQ